MLETVKRKKLEEKMRREERNHTTVHTYNPFLSSNGCVLDSFVLNMMARTLHKRQLTTASHECQSFRQSVFLVRVCLFVSVFVHVMVCVVCVSLACVLRASSLLCLCSRLLGGCGCECCACCLPGAAACCWLCSCCVGVLMLLSDIDET